MNDPTYFADAHMHIVDVIAQGGYRDIDSAEMLFSCTAKYADWTEQKELTCKDHRIVPFYGIHPWFVGEACEENLDELKMYIKDDPSSGIGEIGLDKAAPEFNMQRSYFEKQMIIASELKRPAAIHMIRTEAETLSTMKEYGKGVKKILHSFMGPVSYIGAFTEQDCFFSLSYRFLNKPENKLMQILNAIPEDRLLIESDAPLRDRSYMSMGQIINKLATHMSITPEELISLTRINAKRVIE